MLKFRTLFLAFKYNTVVTYFQHSVLSIIFAWSTRSMCCHSTDKEFWSKAELYLSSRIQYVSNTETKIQLWTMFWGPAAEGSFHPKIAFILNCLYASALVGISVSNLARQQLVQNTLARVVAQKSRFCHITPILADLHWLPCSSQNKFQDCYYHFQGTAFPTAILSRCPCPMVCAHVIPAIFFLVNIHSLTKNCIGKVQVLLIRCLRNLE